MVILMYLSLLCPAMSWYGSPAVSTFDRIEHLIHRSIGVTMGNMPLRDTGRGNSQVVFSPGFLLQPANVL